MRMDLAMISRIGLPLLMAVGGILAWRKTMSGIREEEEHKPQWRDESLDDWRKERDAQIEEERVARLDGKPGERDS